MTAKICNVCNIRRAYTGSKGTEIAPHLSEMCNYCFEEGGWENTHSDSAHDKIDLTNMTEAEKLETQGCWFCFPELNLAQQPAGKSTGPKAQGARRPQLNHKGHSHPATPAARRECKKAFWAVVAEAGVKKEDTLAAMMQSWDIKLDGHGKLVGPANMQPKAAKWHVAPLGPKGGVGVGLKAAAAQAAKGKKASTSK